MDCYSYFSDGYTNKELELHWNSKVPQSRIDFFSAPTFTMKHIILKEDCEDARKYIGKFVSSSPGVFRRRDTSLNYHYKYFTDVLPHNRIVHFKGNLTLSLPQAMIIAFANSIDSDETAQ